MKIFDCTTFYNENLMLEARFNILNDFVDKFVISEAKYSHSGERKKLNFDFNRFKQFKKKIIYLIVENEPDSLIYEKKENNKTFEKDENKRENSIKRIAHQRNNLLLGLNEAEDEDYVFYSDNDEIPNFENFDFKNNKSKIIMFRQKLFYYKFNLYLDRTDWYGTKGCKKKHLISFSWLASIDSLQILSLIGTYSFNLIAITLFTLPFVFFFKNYKKTQFYVLFFLILIMSINYLYGFQKLKEINNESYYSTNYKIKIISPKISIKSCLNS